MLGRIPIETAWRAIDLGCGPLGVLDLLSDRVGPTGHVVELDRERRMLDLAAQWIAHQEPRTIELLEGDVAATRLPDGGFDLAHERLGLVNHTEPERVVK